jgi:hypothetical protein
MAVRDRIAELSMGASSDTNPNPVWNNRGAAITVAKRIARLL